MTDADIEVVDNPGGSRFEVTVDGHHAGAAYYQRHGDVITFTHTEVDDEFEGHGVGSRLARGALDSARAQGLQVDPQCPFIKEYIERHEEYADLVR
jgi:predicted GNAT family acetyltransferase